MSGARTVANITRRDNREGVVGVWMVVALMSLMGMAALVFDVGRLTVAAQHVQNVADAAALAGALQLPDYGVCEARLLGMVESNNGDTPVWPVVVDPANDLVYYAAGSEVPGYGVLEDGDYAVTLTARSTVGYTFARLFGINEVEVTRTATALSTGSGLEGDGLLFAGETRSNVYGINANGSNLTVEGVAHSNTKVRTNGSNQTFSGVEYLYDFRSNGSDNDFGIVREDQVRPYPVDYTWEQFDVGPWDHVKSGNYRINASNYTMPSGRWRIDGNFRVNGSDFHLSDALIVCTGDIDFNGSGVCLDRVTLVAQGEITFNGSTERFSHFQDDLFAMALSSSSSAMKVNGSNSDTWGVLFAPNGGMTYNGSNQEIHHGALIALTIDINGSSSTFQGFGEGGDGGERSVRLIS